MKHENDHNGKKFFQYIHNPLEMGACRPIPHHAGPHRDVPEQDEQDERAKRRGLWTGAFSVLPGRPALQTYS